MHHGLFVWCALPQVFEDMPQEMRSRFWYVLEERPDLAEQLLVSGDSCTTGHGGRSIAVLWREERRWRRGWQQFQPQHPLT